MSSPTLPRASSLRPATVLMVRSWSSNCTAELIAPVTAERNCGPRTWLTCCPVPVMPLSIPWVCCTPLATPEVSIPMRMSSDLRVPPEPILVYRVLILGTQVTSAEGSIKGYNQFELVLRGHRLPVPPGQKVLGGVERVKFTPPVQVGSQSHVFGKHPFDARWPINWFQLVELDPFSELPRVYCL